MIVVDKREKNSLVVAELIAKKQEIRLEHLKVADYLIGDIAIERKTTADFVASMLSKRLLVQLEELKQYPRQLLIIEGIDERPFYEWGKVNPNAIRGMLLSVLLDFKIPIAFTRSAEETAELLTLLEKKQEKKSIEVSLKVKKRAYSLAEQQRFILEAFPGIGPATAKKLLQQFKTIKVVMAASTERLVKAGLNRLKAETMKRIIETEYKE